MHPVVELLTGALFVWWWLIGTAFFQLTQRPLDVIQPVFWLAVGLLLLLITIIDSAGHDYSRLGDVDFGLRGIGYRMLLTAVGIYRQTDFRNGALRRTVSHGLVPGAMVGNPTTRLGFW